MKEKWIKHTEAQRGINVDFYEGAKVKKRYGMCWKAKAEYYFFSIILF